MVACLEWLSPDELSKIAAFAILEDGYEDIREGIERRWHALHALCSRERIAPVLQTLTNGALFRGGENFKAWYFATNILPSCTMDAPQIWQNGPPAEKLRSRCRNEFGNEMDAHLKLEHASDGSSWTLKVESTSEVLLGTISTVLYSSSSHAGMQPTDALLIAFRTYPITAAQLESLTARRATTETRSRIQIAFWRALYRAARLGECGARHLVDWKHSGLDHEAPKLRRCDWPLEHESVSLPSGNVELRVFRRYGSSGEVTPDAISLVDRLFKCALTLVDALRTIEVKLRPVSATLLRVLRKVCHDLESAYGGGELMGHLTYAGLAEQFRDIMAQIEELALRYRELKERLATSREENLAELNRLEVPADDRRRLMALLDLELDRFDPVEQAWEQHVPELLQQWLARMVPTHAALSRTRTTILETATGSSHGSSTSPSHAS